MSHLTEDEAHALLMEAIAKHDDGTIASYARHLGVEPCFVWNMCHRRKPLTGKVLKALGIECEKIRVYKRVLD